MLVDDTQDERHRHDDHEHDDHEHDDRDTDADNGDGETVKIVVKHNENHTPTIALFACVSAIVIALIVAGEPSFR